MSNIERFEAWFKTTAKFAFLDEYLKDPLQQKDGLYHISVQEDWEAWQAASKIPDGYALVKTKLDHNEKPILIGEYSESINILCPECNNEDIECDECKGEGTIQQTVPITWTSIKEIYKRAIQIQLNVEN